MSTSSGRPSLGSHERKNRYRLLLENVEALDDAVSNNVDNILKTQNVVEEAEKLHRSGGQQERVENPTEGLLDSKVLLASSNIITRLTDGVAANVNVYDSDQLADHIKLHPEYWSTVQFPFSINKMLYLYGSFVPGPPAERPQRVRKHVERQKQKDKKEPENVTNVERVDEAFEVVKQIKKFVSNHYKAIGKKPFSYFHLILDPHSFGRTVENIYHVSFLVRDGTVAIITDEETKLPYIAPVSKENRERDSSNDHANDNQFIVSFDMESWKEALEAFKIKEPMLKIKR